MHIPRIFVKFPLQENTEVALSKEAAHRLQNVLRLRQGAPLVVFNGQGGEYEANLIAIEQPEARIRVLRFLEHRSESALTIHLVQGIPRAEKADYILQKSTELGVASITFVMTQYGTVHLDVRDWARKEQRWQDIVIAACEQSGRNCIPTLYPPQTLEQWLAQFQGDIPALLLHPEGNTTLKMLPTRSEAVILVGPEGGFSEREVCSMLDRGFYGVNLGPRILRTETASVAALAALQTLWGDF